MQWETVIGLEVHVQLSTQSKIFSGSSTAFGAEPNTQASAVDLAMPGTLPVLNEQAVRDAIMFGLAINAHINPRSVFERKNYFYPDLPKGYQTSQLDEPIVGPGTIEIQLKDGSHRQIRVHHAHLEEDAGKSLHEDYHGMTGIDLNRAGTPLIEIVSEPDMRNAEEAIAYARKLHSIVTCLGISDGDMSQGSMRFDVNISVRPKGEEKLGTRTETKNLNSYRFMEKAIKLEVERQIDLLEDGQQVTQETRLYDSVRNQSRSMRSKEEANDYRYFPCPDLLPVAISAEYIEEIRSTLPELPDAKQARFVASYGLSDYDAAILTSDRATADYFEATTRVSSDAKLSANWIMGELSAKLNNEDCTLEKCPLSAEQLGQLICRIKDNTISGKIAKQVFEALWNGEGETDAIIESKGLKQLSDSGAIEAMVDAVLAENQAMIDDYKNETVEKKRKKKFNAIVGKVMQASKGKANPSQVNQILQQKFGD
jgi:aspartyl-tRNA(Asn)/glutamyl-tRNA(Gln) amidotransferase subunit B